MSFPNQRIELPPIRNIFNVITKDTPTTSNEVQAMTPIMEGFNTPDRNIINNSNHLQTSIHSKSMDNMAAVMNNEINKIRTYSIPTNGMVLPASPSVIQPKYQTTVIASNAIPNNNNNNTPIIPGLTTPTSSTNLNGNVLMTMGIPITPMSAALVQNNNNTINPIYNNNANILTNGGPQFIPTVNAIPVSANLNGINTNNNGNNGNNNNYTTSLKFYQNIYTNNPQQRYTANIITPNNQFNNVNTNFIRKSPPSSPLPQPMLTTHLMETNNRSFSDQPSHLSLSNSPVSSMSSSSAPTTLMNANVNSNVIYPFGKNLNVLQNNNNNNNTINNTTNNNEQIMSANIPNKITKKTVTNNGKSMKRHLSKRSNLPKRTVEILNNWLLNHLHDPYPTPHEKVELLEQTGLTKIQLSNWFINVRRRKVFVDHGDTKEIANSATNHHHHHHHNHQHSLSR